MNSLLPKEEYPNSEATIVILLNHINEDNTYITFFSYVIYKQKVKYNCLFIHFSFSVSFTYLWWVAPGWSPVARILYQPPLGPIQGRQDPSQNSSSNSSSQYCLGLPRFPDGVQKKTLIGQRFSFIFPGCTFETFYVTHRSSP